MHGCCDKSLHSAWGSGGQEDCSKERILDLNSAQLGVWSGGRRRVLGDRLGTEVRHEPSAPPVSAEVTREEVTLCN